MKARIQSVTASTIALLLLLLSSQTLTCEVRCSVPSSSLGCAHPGTSSDGMHCKGSVTRAQISDRSCTEHRGAHSGTACHPEIFPALVADSSIAPHLLVVALVGAAILAPPTRVVAPIASPRDERPSAAAFDPLSERLLV